MAEFPNFSLRPLLFAEGAIPRSRSIGRLFCVRARNPIPAETKFSRESADGSFTAQARADFFFAQE